MNVEDLDYETECLACNGSGEVIGYEDCPACEGEGKVHRRESAPPGFVRLIEGIDAKYVVYEELQEEDFEDMYGNLEIEEIIEQKKQENDEYTVSIFENIQNEPRETG